MIQCVHVPAGASGSSAMNANDLVPAGASFQFKPGETSAPSQVYFFGTSLPSENAVVFSSNDMA